MRALLIQKDVKLLLQRLQKGYCLRALLIQKDVKLDTLCKTNKDSKTITLRLRALLIQKDVKQ